MKRFTIFTTIFILLLMFFVSNSYSEKKEYKFSSNVLFNEVLNEKLKVDIEKLMNYIEQNPELLNQAQNEAEKFIDGNEKDG